MLMEQDSSSSITLETWVRHATHEQDSGAAAKWNKFWWWTPGGEWPSAEDDVLKHSYGHCSETDTHCFQRLPEGLDEDYTELMAEDFSGNTRLVWKFDSTNALAHAAWRALRHGENTPINSDTGTTTMTKSGNTIASKPQAVWGRPRYKNFLRNGDFANGNPILNEKGSTKRGGGTCLPSEVVTCELRSIQAQNDGPPSNALDNALHGYSGYVLHFGNDGNTNNKGTYKVRSSRPIKITSGTIRVEMWVRHTFDFDGTVADMITLNLKDKSDQTLDIVPA
jgi:hypothetical protein